MGDRTIALGGLTTVPINIGIVVGTILHCFGVPDTVCATIGAAIAVPGAVITHILLMRDLRKQDRA